MTSIILKKSNGAPSTHSFTQNTYNRLNFRVIVADPNSEQPDSITRIATDIASKVSGGATISRVIGLWSDGAEQNHLNGEVEICNAFAIDVSIPGELKRKLLCAIRHAFQRETDLHGLKARWIHTEISEFEAAHFQIIPHQNLQLEEV